MVDKSEMARLEAENKELAESYDECYNMLLDLYNAVSAQSTVDIDRAMLRAEELLDI
jgi:hypothetical protein